MRKYTLDDLAYTVGQNVRKARLEAGLTQADVRKRCGMKSNCRISMVEGGNGNITLKTLVRIADAIGVDVFGLFRKLD